MNAKLSCDVKNCISNCDHKCCRQEIHIGGKAATESKDTCCHSFMDMPEGGFTNDTVHRHPNAAIAIECDAIECVYNKNHKCDATEVAVKNPNSASYGETECSTFTLQ